MFKLKYFTPFVISLALSLCSTAQKVVVNHDLYRIGTGSNIDSGMYQMLQPYADSIGKSMNKVIGFSANGMSKRQPESGLGNFMADCMKAMAEKKFDTRVDAAFINYGGIRSYLPKGEVTIGKIFEIMPFDNLIVLQVVRGDTLQAFLNRVAEKGGWPVSGITMGLKEKKAVNIMVNNVPLQPDSMYVIANSDYIANGGDDCFMLKKIPTLNKGYLLRDALLGYIENCTQIGQSIDANTQNRVVYAR